MKRPEEPEEPNANQVDVLAGFHPAVRTWFERRFPQGPTPPQVRGWPAIERGEHTLIAAPTGSGKTLSAFLVCIDRFYKDAEKARAKVRQPGPLFQQPGQEALPEDSEEPEQRGVEVVYVSPLKALAADIHANLEQPLAEIEAIAREQGRAIPKLRVAVRSGDTPSSARAQMVRKPPQILVTTPESLYLLVTAEKSREILRDVRHVIVDEIHAVARDKRGAHLALSLERLDALCHAPPARIGLSATVEPIEPIAQLLVGTSPGRRLEDGRPRCQLIDVGRKRELDLAIELPLSDLEAVASAEQMGDVLDRIAGHVREHHTTLVFVNTRRMAERLAHQLAERLGEGGVAAHHGSLSKDRRLRVERQLRAGELRALVATASLELGIDVGPVELVCQIGSPRGLSTFLQRVGRSGHFRGGTPKGRLYPTTRDELVESVGLLRGVRAGHLDRIGLPVAPLDILAQQIVAACACQEWKEDDLFQLVRGAVHYADLSREDFDAVIELVSEGIVTGRGRRAAYLHRDRVNGVVRARRGARIAALTSGGAIPEIADYRVVASPDDAFVGTVGEDFAIESMRGDIFLLGSTSWQIQKVESGIVRVVDAHGAPPTIPFWVGEAPARSEELSREVSDLRNAVAEQLDIGSEQSVRAWLIEAYGVSEDVADQVVRYLAASRIALGALPTHDRLIFERFFDESGGMQLIVHSPLGARQNRALCLALRKKFCKAFNFELQAAANDDAMVLSLGPHHSFPLDAVPRYLSSKTAEETLAQAVLPTPMFTARWRWNLNRSLAVLRFKFGRRNPPPIQRMESDDLLAAVFPQGAACQENVTFPIDLPDHPLVRQTMHDCLHEAMDIEGLIKLIEGFESGRVETLFVDTREPSPLCHEILNGRPFTFLDDAPLEERRTRAVAIPRGLPVEAQALGRLDPAAIERVREEAAPEPRDAEELHDLLLSLVIMAPEPRLRGAFDELVATGRATVMSFDAAVMWCATERRPMAEAAHPGARFDPDVSLPGPLADAPAPGADAAVREIVRGHLEILGPVTLSALAARLHQGESAIEAGLAGLEAEGVALTGHFEAPGSDAAAQPLQYCSRRLLTRIHAYTRERLRKEIEPVSAQDFMRFLLRWQHVAPGTRCEGRAGVGRVVEQLQGFELAAGAWEENVFAARIEGYRPDWLDSLCLAGDLVWGRLSPKEGAATAATNVKSEGDGKAAGVQGGRPSAAPSRATKLAFSLRADLPWLLQAHRGEERPGDPGPGAPADVLACLRETGALFHSDLAARLGRLPVEIEEGLWELVARGLVTADGFQAVRSLLGARERWARTRARERARRGLRRGLRNGPGGAAEGRWALFPGAMPIDEPDELAEAIAEQLLARWGVVCRDLMVREKLAVPWRDIVWALRRMEARGVIRGGRFVTGVSGEQYALPHAVDALRRVRRKERTGEIVRVSGADPLNLVGILIPGPRVPAVRSNQVVYRDGLPIHEGEETTADFAG